MRYVKNFWEFVKEKDPADPVPFTREGRFAGAMVVFGYIVILYMAVSLVGGLLGLL